MLDPTAMILADKATRRHVRSAEPNAPIEPDRLPRMPRTDAGRLLVAAMLRRMAQRVEPRTVQNCQTAA